MLTYVKAIFAGLLAQSPCIEATNQSYALNNAFYLTVHDYWRQPASEYEKQKNHALDNSLSLSPTTAHLLFGMTDAGKQSLATLLERYQDNYATAPNPLPAMTPALTKEYESHQNGFRVLYTSEQPQFYAAHYIDTQCMALYQECVKNNPCNLDHILIMRQPCPQQTAEDIDTQKQIRLDYLANGVAGGCDNRSHHQRYLLSCNPSLLSNIENWKECTFRYMLQKHRASTGDAVSLPLDTIFAQYDELHTIFGAHTHTFQEAIDKLVDNTTSGILLQLIFKSDDLLKTCTYSARASGKKSRVLIDGTRVKDPITILNTYCNKPQTIDNFDCIQFRVILTSDLLLDVTNPAIYTNVEMHAYCLDQEVLESFHTTIKNSMMNIKNTYLAQHKGNS